MKIQLLENCIEALPANQVPSILHAGTVKDVDEAYGKRLVEQGLAVPFEDKQEKKVKSETPDDTWTVADLVNYAEEKKIDLGGAKKKDEVLAAIAANKPLSA